ncbi:hypothetical protein EJB05_29982 [Eragrostis curvula]|uniref:Uncharacterized protein n=1 Tax=Eragrostis curvula TaxID=38414 RepID=A0A5J9UW69_9POAL|nr:hypothetical protein EJB05_29982 [Eragrostis curvula]
MKPTAGTVTPQGSPAPAEQSSPKSSVTKRRRMGAALSDVTNLLLPETPTPIKPRRTARRSLPQPSEASSTCSSSASVTPAPKRSSAAVLEEESSVVKSPAISTVYARRGAAEAEGRGRRAVPTTSKAKGKAPAAAAAATASCPPLGKSRTNNSRKTSMAQDTRPISSSAPCHEAKKKRALSSTPKLPEDFVKKQREHFAKIDAYELLEEEVSETDLE